MDKEQIKRDIAAGMSAEQVKAKARGGGYQKQPGDQYLLISILFMALLLAGLVLAMVR
jgi:hypothetical protein